MPGKTLISNITIILFTAFLLIFAFSSEKSAEDLYSVTITVLDNLDDPLPGMNIWIWEEGDPSTVLIDKDTDAEGKITCQLPSNSYEFDVYDYYQSYEYYAGSFSVIDTDVNITVNLDPIDFEILFEILDMGNNPIESAVITIEGSGDPIYTDLNGYATTYLQKGIYDYTVSHACYNTLTASVNIGGLKKGRSQLPKIKAPDYHLLHNMSNAEFQALFTVTDGTEPVMGARIKIDGVIDPAVTDISGEAVSDIECGDYTFYVTAGNYNIYYGDFSLYGGDESIDIILDYDPEYISSAISLNHPSYTGIWLWSYDTQKTSIDIKGSSWTSIFPGITANKMLAGDITGNDQLDLLMLSSDYGLWYYNFNAGTWTSLIASPYNCLDFTLAKTKADSHKEIIVSIKDYGLYRWDYSSGMQFPSSLQKIILVPADLVFAENLSRDLQGIDELAVVFNGFNGLYIYSFSTQRFTRVITVSPSLITSADVTGNGFNELLLSFQGFGVYLGVYIPYTKRYSGLSHDLSYEFIKSLPKNMEFTRITVGTPDPGHHIGTGDIAYGFGSEVFMAYSGTTYMYSYDTSSWAEFLSAPIKRFISGRFAGNARDDLIICESLTGSIYLYDSKAKTFELLAGNGDANSMVALE